MVGKSADEIDEYCKEVDLAIAEGGRIGPGKKDVNLPSKFKFEGGMIFISNIKQEPEKYLWTPFIEFVQI